MTSWLATQFLRLLGWRLVGDLPQERKFVLVAAPHTTNWDFLYLYLTSKIMGVRIYWMGKAELFKGPLGPIARALGGVPVRRDRSNNLVSQMIQTFADRDAFILAIPPAGTRGKTDHWKSGFYNIAVGAQVPIVLGFVDYARKQVGMGPTITPSGDVRADMDKIRAFYADITGKYADGKSDIRLKHEPPASD